MVTGLSAAKLNHFFRQLQIGSILLKTPVHFVFLQKAI
jgi:hypothetical protein